VKCSDTENRDSACVMTEGDKVKMGDTMITVRKLGQRCIKMGLMHRKYNIIIINSME
jgi:hypothetical protein